MVPALIVALLAASIVVIKAADLVIVALRRISKETKAGVFTLSAIILAIGTSLPELFVGITSALEQTSNLSLGNVLGANIANISLVAGLTALIVGRVNVYGDFLKKDMVISLAAGVAPFFLILDKSLGRVDGLILLAIYFAYATGFFRGRFLEIAEEHKKESFFYRFVRRFNHVEGVKARELARLFIGVALLLASADIIVRIAKYLAFTANIPVFLVGLIILSIGTTLPELAFSLRSTKEHEPSMFFGNILGSIITNSTLVIGLVSVINPINVPEIKEYLIALVAFFSVFLFFWLFVKTKRRLDRWEAGLLLLLYLVFVVLEFA